MSEIRSYQKFKDKVAHPDDRIDRVENIRVNGMFDVNFCSQGIESWIEIKSPAEPVRKTTPLFGSNHRISQDQKNWALRQIKAGGRCYFMIMTNRHFIFLHGSIAEEINSLTVTQLLNKSLFWRQWPMVADDWQDVRDILNDYRDYSRST